MKFTNNASVAKNRSRVYVATSNFNDIALVKNKSSSIDMSSVHCSTLRMGRQGKNEYFAYSK